MTDGWEKQVSVQGRMDAAGWTQGRGHGLFREFRILAEAGMVERRGVGRRDQRYEIRLTAPGIAERDRITRILRMAELLTAEASRARQS